MKKVLLCLMISALAGSLHAQDSIRISPQEPQVADVLNILEYMDINIHRFDLAPLLKAHYNVSFYVDEYKAGRKQQRVHSFMFGSNIQPINEYPEDQQDEVRKKFGLAPDEDEFDYLLSATVTVRKTEDSLAYIHVNAPRAGMMATRVQLHPVGPPDGEKWCIYGTRPFRLDAVADADTVEVPLVFYGSAWYDEQYQLIRLCGESEIDPQLQADIVKMVPHFYVVGLRLERQ